MKVFLSHGAQDTWIAKQMARCIEECGAETFLDVNDIETGDEFRSRIRAEIIGSDELVALLTPFSRRRSWLRNEIGVAWGHQKRIVAITYGMTMADLDDGDGGGRGVLEAYQFRHLNDFDAYVHELRERYPMARLFLSYTVYDRDLVERLEQAFTAAGQTVFVDRGAVPAGSSWAETIRDEIEKADAFIVIVSRDSLSRDSAVGTEIGAAWGRRKQIVAVEASDVSVAESLSLPRADYEVVSANGLSDGELAAAILKRVKTDATSAAS